MVLNSMSLWIVSVAIFLFGNGSALGLIETYLVNEIIDMADFAKKQGEHFVDITPITRKRELLYALMIVHFIATLILLFVFTEATLVYLSLVGIYGFLVDFMDDSDDIDTIM